MPLEWESSIIHNNASSSGKVYPLLLSLIKMHLHICLQLFKAVFACKRCLCIFLSRLRFDFSLEKAILWIGVSYFWSEVWTNFILFFIFFTHNTTQHPKYNKTKQQTHTQHLKVQSKGRERGKNTKNTKVTPPYNHVYQTKNTAKHQWSKAWPHRLTPLYIHKSLFAGGYGSNMFFHTCAV